MRIVVAVMAMSSAVFLAGCATSQAPVVPVATSTPQSVPVPDPDVSLDTLKSVVQTLSSDAFEGRAPATPAEDKTVSYIVERMQKAGLQPGNHGSWFQDVPLVELTADQSMALTVTGGKAPVKLGFRTDFVAGSFRVVPKTDIRNSEMVFVGYGINAPERHWNDYAGLDVRGKTVVILVNDPDYAMATLDGPFEGRAMTYYGRWTYKFEEAARQGATAALVVHDTYPAAYPWGVVVSSWSKSRLSMDAANNHMDETVANGWLTNDAARRLATAAGKDWDALLAAAKQPGFTAVPLGLKANLSFTSTIRRQQSKNVIGILPGTTRPDEYVLYSAHWDHLGICEPEDGDNICNGALDNASGVAGILSLAELYKANPPARSVVFIALTAEESGTLGSEYNAANPVYPLAQTVGGVNIDGLNVLGKTRDVVVIGGGKSELEPILERAVMAQGRVIKPEPSPEKGGYFRSDHFSYAKLGVPMIYFESGIDLLNGGEAAGRAANDDYTEHRYHKPSDEYDPNWDWSGAVQDLQLYYRVGRTLADSADWPNWYPSAEFRVIRDKSRSGR